MRNAHFTLARNGDFYEGSVTVEGRTLGARARVIARLGPDTARCRVLVEEHSPSIPDLKIDPVPEGEGSIYRAVFEQTVTPGDPQILKVMTRHPALRSILGSNAERMGTREGNLALAEVVTEAIVRRLMERKYPAGTEAPAAQEFYIDMFSFSTRLLPLMQQAAPYLEREVPTSTSPVQ